NWFRDSWRRNLHGRCLRRYSPRAGGSDDRWRDDRRRRDACCIGSRDNVLHVVDGGPDGGGVLRVAVARTDAKSSAEAQLALLLGGDQAWRAAGVTAVEGRRTRVVAVAVIRETKERTGLLGFLRASIGV